MDELLGLARQTVELMEDTQMLAGSEAYSSVLTAYKLFQSASEAGLKGSDAIYDSLKARFAQTTSTQVVKSNETPTL